jgi:fumarate hydratase, class II
VHPNDHVNASQSSNDTFPTSVHVAVARVAKERLLPALEHLAAALREKEDEWADVVKSGRTHLMDATPVTLGQEFGGYARQVELGIARVEQGARVDLRARARRDRGRDRAQLPARGSSTGSSS